MLYHISEHYIHYVFVGYMIEWVKAVNNLED